MKTNPSLIARTAFCVILGLPGWVQAWTPGTYPAAPKRMHSGGFTVDNQNRNDVVAFWHAVYQASEGYETRINWTGNYNGNNGSVSAAFVEDVERRLNYFRAMCGLPSNVKVNTDATVSIDLLDPFKPAAGTLKSTAAQNAAMLIVRNYNPSNGTNPALSHNPASNLIGWSPAAWNGSAKGNFSFGLYGPGAMTEYMVEALSGIATSANKNALVGHRRWNLYSAGTNYATGDQPGASAATPPTNVFYVGHKQSELGDTSNIGFVAYPSAGFFPAPLNSPHWSLSRAGANFDNAQVRMTDASGKTVALSGIQRGQQYGDPAIVWDVPSALAVRSVNGDTSYNVEVTGISGEGIPPSHSYRVTLINPNKLTSSQALAGPGSLSAKKSASFAFTPPVGAEGLQVVAFKQTSTAWKEDAQIAKNTKVIDGTGSNYPLVVKSTDFAGFSSLAGTSSFRLTFPTTYDLIKRGVPDQFLEIDRDIVANSKAKLTFLFRRGFMTKSSVLAIESSADGGLTWKAVGTPIKGVSDTKYDLTVSASSRPLPKSSTPIRIRFRYYTTGGAIYTHDAAPKSPTGIFLDEITTENCDWLEPKKFNTLAGSAAGFSFSKKAAGATLKSGETWQLRMRTKLGGKWLHYGPPKSLKIAK